LYDIFGKFINFEVLKIKKGDFLDYDNFFKELVTELKIRGYSERTIESYVYENKRFLDFLNSNKTNTEYQKSLLEMGSGRTPQDVTRADIRAYAAHLVSDTEMKPATVNLALSAIRFFYTEVLERDIFQKIHRPKKTEKLPTILTKDEVKNMIEQTNNKKHRILIEMLYGSGLRVSEAVSLKKEDINLDERFNIIRKGKGGKDRQIIMSFKARTDLKSFLSKRKDENPFIFNSSKGHITSRQAQRIVKDAALKAGIKKRVFCHALRASFATHLLNSGVDLREIQVLLGHKRISTTQIYTKVSDEKLRDIRSPGDRL
jgi:integrase/recombinase XerD